MRVLVNYSYYETPIAKYNLEFLLYQENKSQLNSHVDYNIIIQGFHCSVTLPEDKQFRIIRKVNRGYDFGAHEEGLKMRLKDNDIDEISELPYDAFVFLNSGCTGPFLPNYINLHWTQLFCSKLTDQVKLVGSSIVCLPTTDLGGFGPKVEGFFFCLDKIGLSLLWKKGNVFTSHKNKTEAILNGEYGMSKDILAAGYNLDCLIYRYKDIDWRDRKNWKCNDCKFPSRSNTLDGISLHPFETIFHKAHWHDKEDVRMKDVNKYVVWSMEDDANINRYEEHHVSQDNNATIIALLSSLIAVVIIILSTVIICISK
jgi:hypothetical protein